MFLFSVQEKVILMDWISKHLKQNLKKYYIPNYKVR